VSVSYSFHILPREVARKVKQFYENSENVRKFEEWYLKTYGVPYTKKVKQA
jgi:hypothetical protein